MSAKSNLDLEAIKANKNIMVRTYWKNRLEGMEWNDFFDHKMPSDITEEGIRGTYTLRNSDEKLFQNLHRIASTSKAKHMLLLAGLEVLAYKYSSQNDICVFTPTYAENKNSEKEQSIIPVRMNDFGNKTFPEFLMVLKDNLINDFAYGNYAIDRILQKGSDELIDIPTVGMVVQGIQDENLLNALLPDLVFKFELNDTLVLTLEYNSSKYNEAYIKGIAEHYFHLLSELFANKEKPINTIELISSKDKLMILEEFNNTKTPYPADKTMLDFFGIQTQNNPDNIAIQINDKYLTYKELDEKSNQVANFISEKYVEKGNVFGVQMERSLGLMITIFGVLKSGNIYLPLSESHPIDRIQYALENSQAKALFTKPEHFENFNDKIDCLNPVEAKKCSNVYENRALPDDIAYIIYTSGSTGRPKGVLIKHTSLVNRLNWMQNQYQLNENDVILQKTPIVFDVSVWELFWWSMCGAKLVLADPGAEKEPQKICEIIEKQKVTTLHFVPSMLNALLSYLSENEDEYTLQSIKNIFTSGEELKVNDAKGFLGYCPDAQLHNLYGPTEATIDVSYHQVSRTTNYRSIPIGRPIDNTQLFILNKELQHQPIGIPGELFIGGVNLSPGYCNQPELTKERFIENPFDQQSILYKTGDLARWLPSGEIEFLGRIDNQVKIRGNRIELGEIEIAVQSCKGVNSTVVLTKEGQSGLQLIGYVVTNQEYSEDHLREVLASKLPEYMIPSYFITIDQVPVTINGKVDRKALLSLKVQSENEYVAPRTDLEKKLEHHWKQILGLEKIGIHDHFFRTGGDSILAIRLIGALNSELSVTIAMVDLYENDTIEKMALFIESSSASSTSDLYEDVIKEVEDFGETYLKTYPNDQIQTVFPMSDIEMAMCFIHKSRPNDILYFEQLMQPVFYKDLDLEILQKALNLMVDKHEILRTGFNMERFAHIVYKEVDTAIQFYDYSEYSKEEQNQKINEDLERSRPEHFDLNAEKLWRIIIYKIGKDHHEILFEYHHAIIDGWSFASLLTEWNNTYVQLLKTKVETLPKLKATFKDYIVQELFNKKNEETRNFWKEELKGYKRLKLNSDIESRVFRSVRDIYPQQLLKDLEKAAQLGNTTVKNMLLSAYLYAMKILSGENDLLVGLVTFTRPLKPDGEKVLGCFLNTIPLRVQIPESLSWADYISIIDKKVLEVKKYEHLSLFEINQLVGGSTEGNPLFDTFFNYINWHVKDEMLFEKFSDEESNRIEFDTFLRGNTFFDANYDVTNDRIICMHEYSSPFMTKEMYDLYNDIFLNVLSRMVESPQETINPQDFLWNPMNHLIEDKINDYAHENVQIEKQIPASYRQQKQWSDIVEKKQNDISSNVIELIDFKEAVEVDLLKKSVQEVANIHEALRCQLVFKEEKLYQNIVSSYPDVIETLVVENEQDTLELVNSISRNPINLNELLFKVKVVQTKNSTDKLLLCMHNTIIDSFSIQKTVTEIVEVYNALVNKEKRVFNIPPVNYSGFISWEKEVLMKLYPKMIEFWKGQLKEGVEPVQLPKVLSKDNLETYTPSTVNVNIPEITLKKLFDYAYVNDVSTNAIFMAAFKVLLHKYSCQQNITIGTIEKNRNYEALEHIIGGMDNIMAVQSDISEEKTFGTYLYELESVYEKGLDYLAIPFEKLMAELTMRNQVANDIPQINILYQFEEEKTDVATTKEGAKHKWSYNYLASRSSDIGLWLKKKENCVNGKLVFDSRYFDNEFMESFVAHYAHILNELINNPDTKLSEIDILSDKEKSQLLEGFNTTDVEFTKCNSVLELFESQVSKTPDALAIVNKDTTLTYQELNDQVDQMSAYLLTKKDVELEERVGIMLEREAYLVPSIYGVLKSGGAYVPIDPKLPSARIKAILEDAGIRVLITRGSYFNTDVLSDSIELIDLDKEAPVIGQTPLLDKYPSVSPTNLAYIIYTSGSTGIPKGVMIEHQSLLNTIQSMDAIYPLEAKDVYMFKTTHSFDVS
ncbi:amino acid adenylation domain-containing protein, partial [Aquimarina sp. 2304DJ70-9]|uniref:amino acid adenylation domain-containing protein n=1 Tax=Aquimarina penaris TaxID=3231044 RepID=UPI0034629567